MYRYDQYDKVIIQERVAQFRDQVRRRLEGKISENEFKPLRLQNGLYMQLHAYMLRVNIPYGLLSSVQVRKLAHIARSYDKGYAHFSTRQNVQYNWPALEDVPKILDELASVEMHAVQSSGNCIRNTTSDHFAGVTPDEIEDPRPYAELIRQWSTFHPEFAFLPRKFKIAVTGSPRDRAAVNLHDIGVRIVVNEAGERGFEILVGGGLGRTPRIARSIHSFLPKKDLLSYLEAILRVYNAYGRRDNKYKARIKILVDALGAEEFKRQVEEEWAFIRAGVMELTQEELERVASHFESPEYGNLDPADDDVSTKQLDPNRAFAAWLRSNVHPHKAAGYSAAVISLKRPGVPPGDARADELDVIADLADKHGFGRVVVTHRQNLVLPDVRSAQLRELWTALDELGLGLPNYNHAADIIACPGLDYCNLANARSIPIAEGLTQRLEDVDYLHDVGELTLNISGCINACGHHHVGNIGILGIDKQGVEHYQIMLGGSSAEDASLGKILGPALVPEDLYDAVDTILHTYLDLRQSPEESFLDCVRRTGTRPFKERVYVD
jgi:sulfite reductase (NADPH) hemoprotein beta-component